MRRVRAFGENYRSIRSLADDSRCVVPYPLLGRRIGALGWTAERAAITEAKKIFRYDTLEGESWKDVVGYEGLYQVSNLGNVRSVDRVIVDSRGGRRKHKGRILRSNPNGDGYFGVGLHNNRIQRTKKVHKLVAAAWIGPCPEGQQVRHGINGISDNSVSNLCYGIRSQDGLDKRRDGTHGGRPIRRSDGVDFNSAAIAAEETGCSCQSIWNVCNGRAITAGGFHWEYIDNPHSEIRLDKRIRPVRRSDGKEFNSLSEATREMGCSASNIRAACIGRHRTCAGYGWEYI